MPGSEEVVVFNQYTKKEIKSLQKKMHTLPNMLIHFKGIPCVGVCWS